jgi:hypothetical protein
MKPIPTPKPKPIPKKNNTPIVIGDEWTRDDDSIPICDYCSVTMVKLVDRGGQTLVGSVIAARYPGNLKRQERSLNLEFRKGRSNLQLLQFKIIWLMKLR